MKRLTSCFEPQRVKTNILNRHRGSLESSSMGEHKQKTLAEFQPYGFAQL